MISPCDCDCHEYEQIPNKKDQRTYPNTQIRNNFDLEISELKSEIEERVQGFVGEAFAGIDEEDVEKTSEEIINQNAENQKNIEEPVHEPAV